jgi:hypothetical protein
MHFDRFRLLNGSRIRNESGKVVYLRAHEEEPPIEVLPGMEAELPVSPEGETIVDVDQPE